MKKSLYHNRHMRNPS